MAAQTTCPHCGTACEIADEQANRACCCPQCGKRIDAPSASDSAASSTGSSLLGCLLLPLIIAAIDCFGVLLALLLPAVQAAREAPRRAQCVDNLKQIGLAMQGYHQMYGCFPPAFLADDHGKPKHSWRVLILPFLGDQGGLYAEYRFDEPWDGPHNRALLARIPAVYRCPSRSDTGEGQTNYAMIVGPHAISDGATSRSIKDIKDGPDKTMMLAEAAHAGIMWLEPRDLNAKDMTFATNTPPESPAKQDADIASRHPGQAYALFCDGTVRSLGATLPSSTVKALLTIDGGEAVAPP